MKVVQELVAYFDRRGKLSRRQLRRLLVQSQVASDAPTSMRGLCETVGATYYFRVTGVTEGFSKKLLISGVGYRAQAQGKNLKLQLGYSHDVNFAVPEGVDVKTPDQNTVEISGIDKQKVGQVAAEIRRWRKPEPYKGKGIKYDGEFIFRKEGKKK